MLAQTLRGEKMHVLVMGVSGSGKSTIGAKLAQSLGVPFVEADDLHSPANKAKMAAGIPLIDQDRWPWLEQLAADAASHSSCVFSCSALKTTYRNFLRRQLPGLKTIFLHGSESVLFDRQQARNHEFMSPMLLTSQLETLEDPSAEEATLCIDLDQSLEAILEQSERWLNA